MAKSSFNAETPEAAEPAAEQKQAAAPKQEIAVREPEAQVPAVVIANQNQIKGEFSTRDLKIPRVSLVAKTGELSNKFTPGNFVYNQEVVLGDGKTPFPLTILSLEKFYIEDVPYGSEEIPRTFERLEDVRNNEGTISYQEAQENPDVKLFNEACEMTVCVEAPESAKDHPLFSFEFNGKNFGLGLWLCNKSAYRNAGKQIFTDSQLCLRKAGLHSVFYNVTSKINTNSQGSWYVPVVRIGGKHTAEMQSFLLSLRS